MIKKLKDYQHSSDINSAIKTATQKSINKLKEYYDMLYLTTYARIATICDLRFNLSVFRVVLPSSTNNRCRQKLRLNMKECYA
jgi:hypothetical protein